METCLEQHVEAAESPTRRLVYLLDHEYTPCALTWDRLKGEDIARVGALRSAASQADCVAALGLAEIHETWSAFEPDRGRWDRWGYRARWDGEDDDDPERPDDYELDELIESEVSVDRWLVDEPKASLDRVASPASDSAVCASMPSAELTPTASEYEGYMGNWGNTMDRWYRRGAVVLWPRRNDFAVRSAASPDWPLRTLSAQLRAGRLDLAQQFASTLNSFWSGVVTRVAPGLPPSDKEARAHRKLFGRAIEVASGLDDPELALTPLRPFSAPTVSPTDATALARLGQGYGEAWVDGLLAAWDEHGARWDCGTARLEWIATLPALRNSWAWLSDAIATRRRAAPPSRREKAPDELPEPIAALLIGTATVHAADVRDAAVTFLREAGDDLLRCLVRLQRVTACADAARPVETGLRELGSHCTERLERRLARPSRRSGWGYLPLAGEGRSRSPRAATASCAKRSPRSSPTPSGRAWTGRLLSAAPARSRAH